MIFYPLIDNVIKAIKDPVKGFNAQLAINRAYMATLSGYQWPLPTVSDSDVYDFSFVPTRYDGGASIFVNHTGLDVDNQTNQAQNFTHHVSVMIVYNASDPEELTTTMRYNMDALNKVFAKNPTLNVGNGATVINCIVTGITTDEPASLEAIKEQGARMGILSLMIETQEDF